jgi:toxin ParE1/3/4
MAEVKFTIQSLADLDEIGEYISHDSLHYASLQVQKLINRTDILENFPLAGRIVPELKQKSIRELIEGNYRIIYKIVTGRLIHIITFHHSKRKINRTKIKRVIKKNQL